MPPGSALQCPPQLHPILSAPLPDSQGPLVKGNKQQRHVALEHAAALLSEVQARSTFGEQSTTKKAGAPSGGVVGEPEGTKGEPVVRIESKR